MQGPVLLHLLLVKHVPCEHGELVEVRRAHATVRHKAATVRADGSATISDAPADRPAHEHCDALAMRHRLPEVGPAVAAASLVWIELAPAGGERAELRAVPILSLAPKGSPPAA